MTEEAFDWRVYRRLEKQWERERLLGEIVSTMDSLSVPSSGVRQQLQCSTEAQLKELLQRLKALRQKSGIDANEK